MDWLIENRYIIGERSFSVWMQAAGVLGIATEMSRMLGSLDCAMGQKIGKDWQ